MALTETTTSATTCDKDGCTADQEQGIRQLSTAADYRLCVSHATDLYDALDINRRGGRVELFDLA